MDIKLHKQATTTPKIRAEIQAAPSSLTDSELARQYGVSPCQWPSKLTHQRSTKLTHP